MNIDPARDQAMYDAITATCLDVYDNMGQTASPFDLSRDIMDRPEFPMHHYYHHYLVPAVLLTAGRKKQGHSRDVLERDLAVALARARQVPGGSCGFFGACGASVGIGIFFSIFMDAAPVSVQPWTEANRGTARALAAIADVGGPRCCKRCSWLSLLSARAQIEAVLGLDLPWPDDIRCTYHDNNKECVRERCPFFWQPGQ